MAAEHPPGRVSQMSSRPQPAQAAKITELTEANRRLKRKLFDLYTLFEISRNLGGLLEIDRLLDNLLLTTIGQMGVGGACVVVDRRSEDPHLATWRAKGVRVPRGFAPRLDKEAALLRQLRGLRMPADWNDLAQAVGDDGADVQALAALEPALVCPMLVKQEIRGVVVVSRRLSGASFSDNDREFLSILVGHFAVALDNARLYESERDAHLRLREAQAQLVHSEKLAAMGRLSATIAHEVNNPLGIIKNYLHLMRADACADADRDSNLGIVSEEVDRIADIVRRLLDFHRPAKPGTYDLDLWNVIDDCLRLIQKTRIRQQVKVMLPNPRPAAPVHANSEELKQVFLNLFMNALDVMPEGGVLSVRIIPRRRSIVAQVADSGPGIEAESMRHLFEPFFTTKSEGQGTGLGLYVCYGIVQRHGGRIWARNQLEGGAVFQVRLPRRNEDA